MDVMLLRNDENEDGICFPFLIQGLKMALS